MLSSSTHKAWFACAAVDRAAVLRSVSQKQHRPSSADDFAQKQARPASADDLALLQRASEHELQALEDPKPYRYQETLDWNWGSETRSVVETPEGRVDRIVLFNGEPLSPDQQAKQQHRLEKLLSDHDAVKNELKDQKSETQRRARIVKAFPKAFFFDFAGRDKGLLRFDFRPDPDFSPKDRETQMYRGMEGSVWIQPVQERIVRIEGVLVKDVNFGWGIVGHLNKGGTYEIAQTQLSPGHWRITLLDVDLKGKTFLIVLGERLDGLAVGSGGGQATRLPGHLLAVRGRHGIPRLPALLDRGLVSADRPVSGPDLLLRRPARMGAARRAGEVVARGAGSTRPGLLVLAGITAGAAPLEERVLLQVAGVRLGQELVVGADLRRLAVLLGDLRFHDPPLGRAILSLLCA